MAGIMGAYGELLRVDPSLGPGGDLYPFQLTVDLRLRAQVQGDEFQGTQPMIATRCYRIHWSIGPTSSMADWDGTTSHIACPDSGPIAPTPTAHLLARQVKWLVSSAGGGRVSAPALQAELARSLPGARVEVVVDPSPPHYDHPPAGEMGIAVWAGNVCVYAVAPAHPAALPASPDV